jgi:hypothetical protein
VNANFMRLPSRRKPLLSRDLTFNQESFVLAPELRELRELVSAPEALLPASMSERFTRSLGAVSVEARSAATWATERAPVVNWAEKARRSLLYGLPIRALSVATGMELAGNMRDLTDRSVGERRRRAHCGCLAWDALSRDAIVRIMLARCGSKLGEISWDA